MRVLWIILILFGCKAQQAGTTTNFTVEEEVRSEQQIPAWVLRKPADNSYYTGVGNASMQNPEYQATAKAEALDDLASEISVTIESTSLLNQVENRSGLRETFRSSIKAKTNESIEAFELVDSWNDQRQHWVYYRLNKSELARIRKERKAAVVEKAANLYQNAITAYTEESYIQSLHFYAQTIETLSAYLNEKNEVNIDGKPTLLANEAYASIQRIISDISLKSPGSTVEFLPSEKQKTFTITARIKSSGTYVSGLPVTLRQHTSHSRKVANDEGEVMATISRTNATKPLVITANIDFLSKYPITYALIEDFTVPQLELNFSAPAPSFAVRSKEHNLGVPTSRTTLAPLFEKILTQRGAVIETQSSEYILEIDSDTRKGTETSGLYSSYLDLTFTIKDKNEEILFSDSFNDIKGLHTSYDKAGIKAYQSVEQDLSDQITETLNKNFFSKE